MIIQHAVIISLVVLAWHSFTWEGMIFSGIKKIINPKWAISKPIFGCPICITPWVGTLMYYIFFFPGFFAHFNILWQDWFLTIGVACGFSVCFVVLISIKELCDYNKPKE